MAQPGLAPRKRLWELAHISARHATAEDRMEEVRHARV